jgi:hypothetical protein
MADVIVSWSSNPAEEQITGYRVFLDGAGTPPVQSPHTFQDVPMGTHSIEVAAIGPWGEGPHSDPVVTPPAATKPAGVNIVIQIQVT